ncbi:MAG: dihydrofolate reductase [Pseudomonadota bacterium]
MTGAPDLTITLVYARAANGAIGVENRLPWRLPADLRRFKSLTMGKPMIMGRKTFESLPGILPGRRHIVLTRREIWDSEGAEVARSVNEALALAGQDNETGEVIIVGGAAIYDVFMPVAHKIELTQIHEDYKGDTFMPAPGPDWAEVARADFAATEVDGKSRPAYSFVSFERAATD